MMNWEINGLQIPIDLEDLETAKRLEEAFDLMEIEEKQLIAMDSGKLSDKIQGYCNLYLHLFENLFGAETAGQIFHDQPTNRRIYEETYLSFLRFIMDTRTAIADKQRENLRTLGRNREQKRKLDKKYKKKKRK